MSSEVWSSTKIEQGRPLNLLERPELSFGYWVHPQEKMDLLSEERETRPDLLTCIDHIRIRFIHEVHKHLIAGLYCVRFYTNKVKNKQKTSSWTRALHHLVALPFSWTSFLKKQREKQPHHK